jgi:hypothetical protein
VEPFLERGFAAAIGWPPVRFVPITPRLVERAFVTLEHATRKADKVLFNFVKPTS